MLIGAQPPSYPSYRDIAAWGLRAPGEVAREL